MKSFFSRAVPILILSTAILDAADNRVTPSLVLDGLVAHWKLDTAAIADQGPNKIAGSIQGAPAFPDTSIGGRQMNLNGANQFVEATHSTFAGLNEDFSIAVFVRPRARRTQPIVSREDAGTNTGWILEQRADMGLQLRTGGVSAKPIATPANCLVNGRWGHAVVTVKRKGANLETKLYVNARLLATDRFPKGSFAAATSRLMIGARPDSSLRFAGGMDELYLFNRALTDDEIKTLFRPGSRFDYDPLAKVKFEAATLKPGRVSNEALPPQPKPPFTDGKFKLIPGSTVVLIGGGNLEAEQKHGQIETRLTAAHPDHKLRFRNVAWEGDTVYEQWRDVNYGEWAQQLAYLNADALFVQFGQMEALAGKERIPDFKAAYEKLLDEFEKQTRRIVLLSPTPFEKPPVKNAPNLYERNDDLRAYTEAVAEIAQERGYIFVDLFSPMVVAKREQETRDGIHLNAGGHAQVGRLLANSLQTRPRESRPLTRLNAAILEKNRLWHHYWRPMNYAFAFGDRTHVAFGKGEPSLRQELEAWRPFLETAEARIDLLAKGGSTELPEFPRVLERPNSVIAKLTEEEQIQSFTVREDLQANLFASEADGLRNPVQMRWDERGRLWVLCLPTYPQLNPGEKPNDFVLVCEDTDQDGRADKFHRFAEGFYQPMGLELGNDGLYLGHGTELLHLKDTDGDGKADERKVILSGFGTGDSHQLINSLIWGPNGRLWFTQGHHVYSRVETPYGIEKHLKAGVWRLHPHRLKLDNFFELSTAGANCWGVAFDDWGQVFHNTGAQYAAYYTVPGMIRTDHPLKTFELFTGSKNTCIEVLGSRSLPPDLEGVVAFAGFYNNSLPAFRVSDDGSGFKTERLPDLVTSTRREFRPVDIRQGPDGAIYLCDWYNEIVGHYQASYRDPRRDKKHGRVWRVSAKNAKPLKTPDLGGMNTAQLLEQLRSPERWIRYQAKRLLFHRSENEVVAACDAFVAKLDPTEEADLQLLYRVIGVYEAHETLREELMRTLLASTHHEARCYGVRMIGNWADSLANPLDLLNKHIRDEHPRVRLEAIVASTYVPSPKAIEVASLALDAPMDRFQDYALKQAVHALAPQWKPAFERGELTFGGSSTRLSYVLQNFGSKDLAKQVRELALAPNLAEHARNNLLTLLADIGGADDLKLILDRGKDNPALLDELAAQALVRNRRPLGDLDKPTAGLLASRNAQVREAAIRLAGAWKLNGLSHRIRSIANDQNAAPPLRAAAIESHGRLAGDKANAQLRQFASQEQPRGIQVAAIRALTRNHAGIAAKAAVGLFPGVESQDQMSALLEPLLNHNKGTALLARHIADTAVSTDAAKLIARVLSASGRNAPALQEQLNKVLGRANPIPEYNADWVRQFAADAAENGNAAAGRKLFESPMANCLACHKIGDLGGVQGPDLSSIGTGMSTEMIIEAVVWPKRQVKEGYLATTVTTTDDEFYQGYKVKESKEELALREAASGKEVRIPKQRIQERADAGTLMPDGLTAGMTQNELRDLIAYLAGLGRRK